MSRKKKTFDTGSAVMSLLYPVGYYFHQYFEPGNIVDSIPMRFAIGGFLLTITMVEYLGFSRRLVGLLTSVLHILTLFLSLVLIYLNNLGLSYVLGLSVIITSVITTDARVSFIRWYTVLSFAGGSAVVFLTRHTEGLYIDPWLMLIGLTSMCLFSLNSRSKQINLTARLEVLNRNKSDFLKTFSHEIRTPLNGILPVVQLLKREPLNERQLKFVEMIQDSGRLLLNQINGILDVAKIEAGQVELKDEPFDAVAVLSRAASVFEVEAGRSGTDITVASDVDSLAVNGDGVKISQIITNFVSNAVKYTHNGQIKLSLQTSVKKGQARLVYRVFDSGQGIPSDKLESIFREFEQLPSPLYDQRKGTGLGLPITRKLATLMKGRVYAQSPPGDFAVQGSVFTFEVELPLCRPDEGGSVPGVKPFRFKRALLIDPVPVNNEALQGQLSRFRLDCRLETEVPSEISIAKQPPDIIFLAVDPDSPPDVSLTFKNDTLKNGGGQGIVVVAVVEKQPAGFEQKCNRAGYAACLTRPVDYEKLTDLFSQLT